MEFGEGLKFTLPFGDWESALRIRKRLFSRGYAKRLFINSVRTYSVCNQDYFLR